MEICYKVVLVAYMTLDEGCIFMFIEGDITLQEKRELMMFFKRQEKYKMTLLESTIFDLYFQ